MESFEEHYLTKTDCSLIHVCMDVLHIVTTVHLTESLSHYSWLGHTASQSLSCGSVVIWHGIFPNSGLPTWHKLCARQPHPTSAFASVCEFDVLLAPSQRAEAGK